MMTGIKNIIWDLDGTLVDSYPVMARLLQNVLNTHGIETSYEDVYEAIKVSMGHAIQLFAGPDPLVMSQVRAQFIEREGVEPGASYQLFSDTIETLKHLVEKGINNFVLTHRNTSTYKIMKATVMEAYILDTITIDDGFRRKPDPEAFLYLMNKHDLSQKTTLNVGDRLFDIQAGRGAGLLGCLIKDAYNKSYLDEADYIVSSRRGVLDLIEM